MPALILASTSRHRRMLLERLGLPFTAVVTLADEGNATRYVATVMHPDKATRDRHEKMGFFDGWNTCIDQLEAFAVQLR